MAQTVKNMPVMQETQVRSLDREDPLEKGMAIFSWRKDSFSCLENLVDRGAWWTAVHGVAKSQARLRD